MIALSILCRPLCEIARDLSFWMYCRTKVSWSGGYPPMALWSSASLSECTMEPIRDRGFRKNSLRFWVRSLAKNFHRGGADLSAEALAQAEAQSRRRGKAILSTV